MNGTEPLAQTGSDWLNDSAYLEELQSKMLRFARQQLSNATLAEDMVQEALLGALKSSHSFSRQSAYSTWVIGILKHKIADHFRQIERRKEVHFDNTESDSGLEEQLFDAKGFWHKGERPKHWGSPEDITSDDQFMAVFEACLQHLPAEQGRLFMMREFVGLSTEEMCTELNIGKSNLYVTLYRARLRLRECLENHWFS
ncbi:MAG: sigma-70 family RNA polymerase sigma factor [Pseudomonadota bacterium]